MKITAVVPKGTILVAIEDQTTFCGINYIRKGSIIKVAKNVEPWAAYVRVFRNKKAENENYYHNIDLENVREANELEIKMWDKEMYFIETVKTF